MLDMKQRIRLLINVAIAAVIAFSLAACGGGEDDKKPGRTAEGTMEQPVVLVYGQDFPHTGRFGLNPMSYYLFWGLTPGKIYQVNWSFPAGDYWLSAYLYPQIFTESYINQSSCYLTPGADQNSCLFAANADGQIWMSAGGSLATVVFDVVDTGETGQVDQGTKTVPIELGYPVDSSYSGSVNTASYYHLSGLTSGETYTISLTSSDRASFTVYNDQDYSVYQCGGNGETFNAECDVYAQPSGEVWLEVLDRTDREEYIGSTFLLEIYPQGSVTPDSTAPGPVTSLVGTPLDSAVLLNWVNPADADLAGVYVYYSQVSPPTSVPYWDRIHLPSSETSYVYSGLTPGATYYFGVWAVDTSNNVSPVANVTVVVSGPDEVPPAEVTDLTASPGNMSVSLSWTNPGDADFAGVMVRRSSITNPGVADGDLVGIVATPGNSLLDDGLMNYSAYYYTLFTFDYNGNYSVGAYTAAMPEAGAGDTTPPGVVSGLRAIPSNGQVVLEWVNPGDADFAGVMLRRSTGSAPATSSDGSLVTQLASPGATYTDSSATNGLVFYYSAFTYDGSGNFSAAVSLAVMPGLPGTLDKTLNSTGKLTYDGASNWDEVHAVTTDSQGRILVAGYRNNGTDGDMAVLRYNADGTLDTGFGTGGLAVYDSGNGLDRASDMVVDSSGNIILAGYVRESNGTNADIAVVRFTSGGVLDAGFATGGVFTYGTAALDDYGNAVALDGSGNIVVAAQVAAAGWEDMAVLRLTSAGSLDNTFSGDGVFTHNNAAGGGTYDRGWAVAIDASDRIVVAGNSAATTSSDMVVWRLTSTGVLDNTFSGDGIFVHSGAAGGGNSWADNGQAVLIDSQGRIVVAGESADATGYSDLAVWRLTTAGALDSSFGTGGIVTHAGAAGTNSFEFVYDLLLDANDGVYVAGSGSNGTDYDAVVWAFTSAGVLDTGFGSGGVVVWDSGLGSDYAQALAQDDVGRILVGLRADAGDHFDMGLLRLVP